MKTWAVSTLFVLILAVSCASCATGRDLESDIHSRLGGPSWRVTDVNSIDNIDDLPALRSLWEAAEACAGMEGNFSEVTLFAASHISSKRDDGNWMRGYDPSAHTIVNGIWIRERGWIYIRTGRPAAATARTIIHEFIHHLTGKGHDDEATNEIIAACVGKP